MNYELLDQFEKYLKDESISELEKHETIFEFHKRFREYITESREFMLKSKFNDYVEIQKHYNKLQKIKSLLPCPGYHSCVYIKIKDPDDFDYIITKVRIDDNDDILITSNLYGIVGNKPDEYNEYIIPLDAIDQVLKYLHNHTPNLDRNY